jgi:SEC-C motif
MDRKGPSRNDACPCGSGKKYKHCCLRKDVGAHSPSPSPRLTDLHGKPKNRPEYPIGTVALYGPDDNITTKIAAGVITSPTAEPILMR